MGGYLGTKSKVKRKPSQAEQVRLETLKLEFANKKLKVRIIEGLFNLLMTVLVGCFLFWGISSYQDNVFKDLAAESTAHDETKNELRACQYAKANN